VKPLLIIGLASAGLAALALAGRSAAAKPAGPGPTTPGFKAACPPETLVLGIDVSSYQHPGGATIDWSEVAKSRRFAFIKATEGNDGANPHYQSDASESRAAGMLVGAYHFLTYGSTGEEQAVHFLETIGSIEARDLPPMLDVEATSPKVAPEKRVEIMRAWLELVERATGRKPIIYCGAWYWSGYLGSPTGFDAHPLAWAAYTKTCPNIPADFPGLAFWQYLGDKGRTPGIRGGCDQQQFYGSETELLALTGAT
jgi:lysozyme